MAKEALYFTHDFGARNDPKMINLQIKHGMLGVGCYWSIVEMLFEQGGEIPLEYERISFELRTDTNVLKSVINDFGLFIIQDEMLSSKSVLARLEIRNSKSAKARESVNNRWNKYRENTNVQKTDTNVLKNDTIKERKEIKEIKVNSEFDYLGSKNILTSENEKGWRETIMMLSPIKSEPKLISKINEFLLLQSANGFFPNEITDTKRYFANWIRSQKPEPHTERKSREKNPVI